MGAVDGAGGAGADPGAAAHRHGDLEAHIVAGVRGGEEAAPKHYRHDRKSDYRPHRAVRSG